MKNKDNVSLGPDHWRYVETLEPDGVKLQARRYVVVGETPRCWYVLSESYASYLGVDSDYFREIIKRRRKRVLKQQDHGRRFCYVDRKLALHSLIMRKKFELRRVEMRKAVASLALAAAEAAYAQDAVPGDEIEAGHNEYTSGLNFVDW